MSFHVKDLHHVSLLTADLQRSLDFYVGIIGLAALPRPDLGYPGAWLRVGNRQIHLMVLPNPDPMQGRPAHGGRDRHWAFSVSGIDELKTRLARLGIPYTESRSGRTALFCRDPDGNALEFVESGVDS